MEICMDSQCLKVELIAWSIPRDGTVDQLVAESGAISHAPDFRELSEKRVRNLIELLRRLGHESVFEHACFTFRVEGISRVASHQLVRHRLASYTQQSQRYVKLKSIKFVMPDSIANSEFENEYRKIMEDAAELYQKMVDAGIRKEDARFVLPQSVETKIVLTMNARELRHFFKLRCDRAAQWEIRNMAMEMLKQVHEVAPILFEDLYQEYVLKNQDKSEGFIS